MIGVVTLASGRTALIRAATRSSPITIAAEVQPNATTSSGTPGMMTEARVREPALHRRQRLGRDPGVVQDPALVQPHAGHVGQDAPPLVLDRVVGREHDQPEPRARGDARVEREGQAG